MGLGKTVQAISLRACMPRAHATHMLGRKLTTNTLTRKHIHNHKLARMDKQERTHASTHTRPHTL